MAIVPWVGRRGWAGGEPRRTAKRSAGDGFGALRDRAGHPVDSAALIVGDEQGTVVRHEDIRRAT